MREMKPLRWMNLALALMIAGGATTLAAQERAETNRILIGPGEGSWIGVVVEDVNSGDVQKMKLPGDYGAVVTSVESDSPAAKAGIQKGDVILMFSGERVFSIATLRRLVRETPAGRTVEVQIGRNGAVQNLEITPQKPKGDAFFYNGPMFNGGPPMFGADRGFKMMPLPNPRSENREFNFRFFLSRPVLGISADDLTPQLAKFFGVEQGKGVLVREVTEGSPAAKAGLKAGDVIVKVGPKEVGSVDELREALGSDSDRSRTVRLTIVRNHEEQGLDVKLEPPSQGLPDTQAWEGFGLDAQQAKDLARQAKRMTDEYQQKSGDYQKAIIRMQKQLQIDLQPLKDNLRLEMEQLKLPARDEIKHHKEIQRKTKGSLIV